jgi:hypothetical protein
MPTISWRGHPRGPLEMEIENKKKDDVETGLIGKYASLFLFEAAIVAY